MPCRLPVQSKDSLVVMLESELALDSDAGRLTHRLGFRTVPVTPQNGFH